VRIALTLAIVAVAFIAACAHVEPSVSTPVAVVDDAATELQRCVDDGAACPALAKRVEAKLRAKYDASAAHRLAWQMTEMLGRGDASVLGATIARCGTGHPASCRALWWAIERLYLDGDATPARAHECGLTEAVASYFILGRDSGAFGALPTPMSKSSPSHQMTPLP